MLLDALIVVVVLVAVLIGYQRGIVQPLLSEIGFFGTLIVILVNRQGYSSLIQRTLHTTNVAAMVFIALLLAIALGYGGGVLGGRIHKMPVVRGVDGFLGIVLHLLVAVLVLYEVISAIVIMGQAFNPAVTAANLTLTQVQLIESQLASNPLARGLIDPRDLAALKKAVSVKGGAGIEAVPAIHNLASFFNDWLEPQLRSSRLAKYVVTVGYHVPLLGHVSPRDLPTPVPTAGPSPSPSPKPTK